MTIASGVEFKYARSLQKMNFMNKLSIFTVGALFASAFMACDGYKEPNPPAQSNPQLPILQTADVSVANVLTTATYNLTELAETGSQILLAKVNCDKLGEGYTFGAEVYIGEEYGNVDSSLQIVSQKIDAQNEWEIYLSPAALSNLYHETISWNNEQTTIKLWYNITTVYDAGNGSQVAYVGGLSNIYGPYDVTIIPIEGTATPDQPETPGDYDFDYLYTPGQMNGWSFDNNMMLSTTDHKVFSGFVYILGGTDTGSGDGFKLVSGNSWEGTINWGLNEDGELAQNGTNITVETTGLYYVSANLSTLKLDITLIDNIEMIGAFNGWADEGVIYMTDSDDLKVWKGELTIESEESNQWKFRMNNAWDINLGAEGDVEPVEVTPGEAYNLSFGGKNFSLPAGTYEVTLDLSKLPYTTTVMGK